MVSIPRLTAQQGHLRVDAADEPDFRLRSVLAGQDAIERGDEGPAVRFLQQLLNRFGADLATDGDFGDHTLAAVRRFQRGHGLDVDGVVGQRTLRALLKRNPETEVPPLREGQGGARVERLERDLARLGYLDRAEVGGRYDADTARAVRGFRRDQAELPDYVGGGVAGAELQRSLSREVRALAHAPEHGRRERTEGRVALDHRTAVAVRAQPIGEGDERAPLVANVQRHLRAAGYDPKRTDGQFDERTGAALEAFQRRSHLPATGQVDEATWRALRGSIVLAKDGTSPPQALGERSAAVRQSEALLQRAGYDPGKVDGLFDRDTLRALHRFERDHPRAGHGDTIGARQLDVLRHAAQRTLVRPVDARLDPGSEFALPDAEGAPANDGRRYHAGKDWFAPGGSPVRAPVEGTIVEVRPSLTDHGQVFGGTVKVQGRDGKVWVFRHVNPADVHVGQHVRAGQRIARVTDWKDGPDHTHIELWKNLKDGYDFENMIDPMKYLSRFL